MKCSLEDDRGTGPAERSQLPGLEGYHVLAIEEDVPLDLRLRCVETKDRARDRGFPAARLSRESEDLALSDLEFDTLYRGNVAALGPVGHTETAHR